MSRVVPFPPAARALLDARAVALRAAAAAVAATDPRDAMACLRIAGRFAGKATALEAMGVRP